MSKAKVFAIRECHLVDGDWFCVTHQLDEKRWVMERIILWAIGKDEDHVVRAIIGYGGITNLTRGDWLTYYVKGSDTSPVGKTWDEIYGSVMPDTNMKRDITELFGDSEER